MSFASTWSIRGWGGGSEPLFARNPTGTEHLSTVPSPVELAGTVRSGRWSSAVPLLASLATGAALLWAAAAPPPSVEAQQLYSAGRSDAMYRDPAADVRYEPTPNWVWPHLGTEPSPSSMVSCSADIARSHC
jgi:hypothetical protein